MFLRQVDERADAGREKCGEVFLQRLIVVHFGIFPPGITGLPNKYWGRGRAIWFHSYVAREAQCRTLALSILSEDRDATHIDFRRDDLEAEVSSISLRVQEESVGNVERGDAPHAGSGND